MSTPFEGAIRSSIGADRAAGRRRLVPQARSPLQVRNPVMFVVEVGSVLTTGLWLQALVGQGEAPAGFIFWVIRLALVHRAVRELRRGDGRGPRQGPGRRAAQDAPATSRPNAAQGPSASAAVTA